MENMKRSGLRPVTFKRGENADATASSIAVPGNGAAQIGETLGSGAHGAVGTGGLQGGGKEGQGSGETGGNRVSGVPGDQGSVGFGGARGKGFIGVGL